MGQGHSTNKTVRHVAYVHDTNVYGGVEIFLLLLLKYINTERYEPTVIVPGYSDPWRGSPPRFTQQVQEMGIRLIKLPVPTEIPGIRLITQIQNTGKILKEGKFDVLHIHTCRPLGARIATISAWLSGIPVRLRTEHLPPIYISPYTRYFVKPLDWITDLILTVSDANLDDQLKLLNRNPHKLFRSYPGIELDRFDLGYDIKDAKSKIGLDPELPVVGLVGRLVEQKGHTYLINAIPRIIKEFGPVNFLFIGEGPLENQLRKQVEDLEMGQYVHFEGYQSNPYQFMKAMDIGVMPSLQEGLPIALLEFMAFGKPVLASSLPCFNEAIVDGESGVIVSLDDENSLADNTLMLLRNPDMAVRMGQSAQERVQSPFNIQRLANHMMDLYDSLLEDNQNN